MFNTLYFAFVSAHSITVLSPQKNLKLIIVESNLQHTVHDTIQAATGLLHIYSMVPFDLCSWLFSCCLYTVCIELHWDLYVPTRAVRFFFQGLALLLLLWER